MSARGCGVSRCSRCSGASRGASILIVIRTVGTAGIGLGHVRRTLTLAGALQKMGTSVTFLLEGRGAAARAVQGAGFEIVDVTDDLHRGIAHAQSSRPALIVIDTRRHTDDLPLLLETIPRNAVVDDLGQPPVEPNLLTNSAIYASELPYRRHAGTAYLLGPAYTLLREEFAVEPPQRYPERMERIVITLGGSDPFRLTPHLVTWARVACPDVEIVAIVGPFFDGVEAIRAAGPDRLLVDPPAFRDILVAADLVVSGGGQTTYELAAAGRPCVAIRVADDQGRNLEALARAGVLLFIGTAHDPRLETTLRAALHRLAGDAAARAQMGRAGRALVDGQGARRVAQAVMSLI